MLLQHIVTGYAETTFTWGRTAQSCRMIAGHPGTLLSQVESKAFEEWAPGFYERLRAHMKRASDSIGWGRLSGHLPVMKTLGPSNPWPLWTSLSNP